MAYNNFYPASYQPFYTPYQQPMQNQQLLQNPQQLNQQNQQIQSGGFVSAPSEEYARNYPVAPGNSVTFKDEKQPYVYTKTMSYSPLEPAVFEKYKLVKENAKNAPNSGDTKQEIDMSVYALKTDLAAILGEIDAIKATVETMKQKKQTKKEKEDE